MSFRGGLTAGVVAGALLLAGCSTPQDGTQSAGRKVATSAAQPVAGLESNALPEVRLRWLTGGGTGQPEPLSEVVDGTPTVLNIWAQWCPPCREESPYFQRLYVKAKDRLNVIGIDQLDGDNAARKFMKDHGLAYPQLADDEGLLKAPFRLGGLPATVFVDAQGRIVHLERTPYRTEAKLFADVRKHLGVKL